MSPNLIDHSGDQRAAFEASLEFGVNPVFSPGYPPKIDHEYVESGRGRMHSITCPCDWTEMN